MPEFEVTLRKVNTLRSLIASRGGILWPTINPAALSEPEQTIQILNGEPVVVTLSIYQSTDRRITSKMHFITSNGIADQEWFKEIVPRAITLDDELEMLRKRMHKVDNERRRALTRALNKAADYP